MRSDNPKNSEQDPREIAGRKEWQRPSLQKLPIAMTAGNKGTLNEGQGVGKGDSGTKNVS
jgi:hypothetical protein